MNKELTKCGMGFININMQEMLMDLPQNVIVVDPQNDYEIEERDNVIQNCKLQTGIDNILS